MSYLCADRFAAYNTLTVTATASRSSGLAPCVVTFDATSTTDSSVANAFRDLYYLWDFGDSGSGTFTTGRASGLSKNAMTGAVGGHVYESAGTYTPTVTVFNGLASKKYTLPTITVSAWPNDANTICVGNVLPVQGVGGVPSNATCVASSDFGAAIGSNFGTNKRVLFKKGDTFASSAATNLTAPGPSMIGAYGTGALPIVTSTNLSGVVALNNATATDCRVVDLDIRGNGATDTGVGMLFGADISKPLLLRVSITEIGKGIVCSGTSSIIDGGIQECTVNAIYAPAGGVAFFGAAKTSTFLGNALGPITALAEHVLRIQPAQKTSVYANTLDTPSEQGKVCLAFRAQDHTTGSAEDPDHDAYLSCASDNKLDGGNVAINLLQIGPASTSQNNWIRDIVFERNLLVDANGTASTTPAIVCAIRATLRNNITNASGALGFLTFASVYYTNTAGVPYPDDVRILNNSMYSSDADVAKTATGVDIDTEPTATVVMNNLDYTPTASAGDMIAGTGTSPGTLVPNSSDAQVKNTDPYASKVTFAPQGYALNSGASVAVYDEYDGTRTSYGNTAPVLNMGAVQTTVN